jgi:hypothetical protein
MKSDSGPGLVDVLVVIASPVIVAVMTVIFLMGWWTSAAWDCLRGDLD